jgi:hypothetical protein
MKKKRLRGGCEERRRGQRLTRTRSGCWMGVLINSIKRDFVQKHKENVLDFMEEFSEKKVENGG